MIEHVISFVVHAAICAFWYWLGRRAGVRAMAKATVDHVLKQPVPRRNYEERMLEYTKLHDRPDAPRIIL